MRVPLDPLVLLYLLFLVPREWWKERGGGALVQLS